MKILVVGAGMVGSLYAGRLAPAGQDIALLARGIRLKQLRRDGLVLLDETTGQDIRPPVRAVEELQPDDDYDLIIIVVRAERLAAALPLLVVNRRVPCILFLQNHPSGPQAVMTAVGPERVLLGFLGASGARGKLVTANLYLIGASQRYEQTAVSGVCSVEVLMHHVSAVR